MVSEQLTALSDILATCFYVAAAYLAVQNYRLTRGVSNYWLIFAFAMGLGALLSLQFALERLDIYEPVMEELQPFTVIMLITALIITSIDTLTTHIDVVIE